MKLFLRPCSRVPLGEVVKGKKCFCVCYWNPTQLPLSMVLLVMSLRYLLHLNLFQLGLVFVHTCIFSLGFTAYSLEQTDLRTGGVVSLLLSHLSEEERNALCNISFPCTIFFICFSRPSVLDSFALLSGQLNTLNKVLKHEKTPLLRNQVIIPLVLSPDRDEEIMVSMSLEYQKGQEVLLSESCFAVGFSPTNTCTGYTLQEVLLLINMLLLLNRHSANS